MLNFEALPAIQSDYFRLRVLSREEKITARWAGYIEDRVEMSERVNRAGVDTSEYAVKKNDVKDWRVRFYVVWFCYLYENLGRVHDPLGAIEELMLEFKAPDVIDLPNRRLGSLYAGVGGDPDKSISKRQEEISFLKPHYDLAIGIFASLPSKD